MTKLFLKVFYTTFLWLILLANLLFVFDLVHIVNPLNQTVFDGDLSNKYFGVSTLIESLRNIDHWPVGKFTSSIGEFQKNLYSLVHNIFEDTDWNIQAFQEIKNPLDFISAIFNVLISIGRYIAGSFVFIFAGGTTLVYYTLMLLTIMFSLLNLLGGWNVSTVPTHMLWGLGNFIAPLLALV